MHYLIEKLESGDRIVDFSISPHDLFPQLKELQTENTDSTPVLISEQVLKSVYLTDDFGIPVKGEDGLLTMLSEI